MGPPGQVRTHPVEKGQQLPHLRPAASLPGPQFPTTRAPSTHLLPEASSGLTKTSGLLQILGLPSHTFLGLKTQ